MANDSEKKDIGRLFRERKPIDEALNAAAREAVKRHRQQGQPRVLRRALGRTRCPRLARGCLTFAATAGHRAGADWMPTACPWEVHVRCSAHGRA